jgi:hypothetical protein
MTMTVNINTFCKAMFRDVLCDADIWLLAAVLLLLTAGGGW